MKRGFHGFLCPIIHFRIRFRNKVALFFRWNHFNRHTIRKRNFMQLNSPSFLFKYILLHYKMSNFSLSFEYNYTILLLKRSEELWRLKTHTIQSRFPASTTKSRALSSSKTTLSTEQPAQASFHYYLSAILCRLMTSISQNRCSQVRGGTWHNKGDSKKHC